MWPFLSRNARFWKHPDGEAARGLASAPSRLVLRFMSVFEGRNANARRGARICNSSRFRLQPSFGGHASAVYGGFLSRLDGARLRRERGARSQGKTKRSSFSSRCAAPNFRQRVRGSPAWDQNFVSGSPLFRFQASMKFSAWRVDERSARDFVGRDFRVKLGSRPSEET